LSISGRPRASCAALKLVSVLPLPVVCQMVAARRQRAQLPMIGGRADAQQDAFGRDDLVGPHHQQLAVHVEHAIAGQDVQQRVRAKKVLVKPPVR
jgi:hypothetical protein